MNLNSLETAKLVQKLNRQQLQGCLRRKPRPNGNETSPQTQDPVVLDRLDGAIHKTVVNLFVRRLVHQPGAQIVRRRHGAGHEKAGHKGRGEGRAHVLALPARQFRHVAFGKVVATHFGGVENAGAHDVDFDTAVETGNALVFVHLTDQRGQSFGLFLVGLRQCFHDIKGVAVGFCLLLLVSYGTRRIQKEGLADRINISWTAKHTHKRFTAAVTPVQQQYSTHTVHDTTTNSPHNRPGTTGDGPGQKLDVKGGVLAGPQRVAHGRVRPELDARVGQFAPVGKGQALPKGGNALGFDNAADGGADPGARHLHAGFDGFLVVVGKSV